MQISLQGFVFFSVFLDTINKNGHLIDKNIYNRIFHATKVVERREFMNKIIPLSFDPIFTGIFNDEKNIDIVENFLSLYLKVPIEKLRGKVIIKSRKLKSSARKERRKEIDLLVDIDGKKINIELNNNYYEGIRERNIVYICKVHGGQLKTSDNSYKNINNSVQINLNRNKCNEKKLIDSYYIMNENGKKLSEKLRIDLVDIAKAEEKEYNESDERLAKFLRALTSLSIEEIEKELGEDVMEKESKEKLLDEVEKYNEDEEIVELYSNYSKTELEINTFIEEIKEAKEELKQAKEEVEQAKEEAKLIKENIVKKMLEDNLDNETISKYTGLTIEKIEELK